MSWTKSCGFVDEAVAVDGDVAIISTDDHIMHHNTLRDIIK
jgi:hypothetical protein